MEQDDEVQCLVGGGFAERYEQTGAIPFSRQSLFSLG
jgi:hypothetical protein